MDASEIYSERLNAKGSNISQSQKRKLHISSCRWTNQTSGGDQELRTSTLIRDHPIRGEDQRIFPGESEGCPPLLKTHFRMPVKHEMIFVPFQETSYTAITLNPESNFARREKSHSLFH